MDLLRIMHKDINASDAGKYMEMKKVQGNNSSAIKNVQMFIAHNGRAERVLNGLR